MCVLLGFTIINYLKEHLTTHSSREDSPTKLTCSVCTRNFLRYNNYLLHLKKHAPHQLNHNEKKVLENGLNDYQHVCEICKRAYKTAHQLKKHLLMHGEKKFLCNFCGKGFTLKALLQLHLKVHTGEKPHVCNVCPRSFADPSSLSKHLMVHSGQKPYRYVKSLVCWETLRTIEF